MDIYKLNGIETMFANIPTNVAIKDFDTILQFYNVFVVQTVYIVYITSVHWAANFFQESINEFIDL